MTGVQTCALPISVTDSTVERLCRRVWGLGLLKGLLERDCGDGRVGSGQRWSRCRGGRPLNPRRGRGLPGVARCIFDRGRRRARGRAGSAPRCPQPPALDQEGRGPGVCTGRWAGGTGGLPSPGFAGTRHTQLLPKDGGLRPVAVRHGGHVCACVYMVHVCACTPAARAPRGSWGWRGRRAAQRMPPADPPPCISSWEWAAPVPIT